VDAVLIKLQPQEENAPELPVVRFDDAVTLGKFRDALQQGIDEGESSFEWRSRYIEIRGNGVDQLATLQFILSAEWGAPPLASYAQVFDLGCYSHRVIGFGEHKPVYSPYRVQSEVREIMLL